jgi:hypothetical protein
LGFGVDRGILQDTARGCAAAPCALPLARTPPGVSAPGTGAVPQWLCR